MIAVKAHERGTVLPVRAKAGARFDGLLDDHDGALRVAVTAPPDQGRANQAIIEVLAEALNLRKSQIELVAGATSKIKKFLIVGIEVDDLMGRIDAALEPTMFEPPDADV